MGHALAILQSGDWLTRERMRLVALTVLFVSLAGLGYLLATANGLNDYAGRPLGTDFSNVYAAGQLVLDGRPEAAFDPAQQYAREQAIFGAATPFYGWHYPPFFLLVAASLALMPYPIALAIWQGFTLLLYLLTIRAIAARALPSALPRNVPAGREQVTGGPSTAAGATEHLWLLLALAFPAVLVNLGHGHNGFLTAALFGGALVLLDRRPILAGILFGLMAYKPQFGVMIPLVLAATGRWRTIAAAAATVGALALATTLAFGAEVWSAFLAFSHFTRTVVLEQGDTGWHKIQTVFSWIRMWGGQVSLAYAMQGAVTLTLAGSLVWLWRSRAAFELKAGALVLASLLATPYSLDYDMMVLAPAIAFLCSNGLTRGFAPYEKSMLAALWFVPLIARAAAEATLAPLGVITMGVAFVLVIGRAGSELGAPSRWLSRHGAVK